VVINIIDVMIYIK